MTATPPRMDDRERRNRLGSRHHLAVPASSVGNAAASLIGLHSTDPATVYLSAWARVDGLSIEDVDDALYGGRTIVKHLAMRRTVWAVATELLPIVQSAASDAIAATERRRTIRDLERSGVTTDGAAWLRRAERAAMRALERLGPAFGRDLSKQVPQLRAKITIGSGEKAQEVGVVTRISTILSASGQITRARPGGAWHERQPRWVRMVDWVPDAVPAAPMPPDLARTELARLWLYAFGPATLEDLKWWTGWTLGHTRAALGDVGAVEVELSAGALGFVLADDVGPAPAPDNWVALLPSLDPTTMGWTKRAWYLGPHGPRLFDRYGNAGPTIWVDGRVVGGWGQRPDGEVVLGFLEDVGSDARAAASDRAAALTKWLDGVRVRPSFPTPLHRDLSA